MKLEDHVLSLVILSTWSLNKLTYHRELVCFDGDDDDDDHNDGTQLVLI